MPSWLNDLVADEEALPSSHPTKPYVDLESSEATVQKSRRAKLERTDFSGNVHDPRSETKTLSWYLSRREQLLVTQPISSVRPLMNKQKKSSIVTHDKFCNKLKYCQTIESIQGLAIELDINVRAMPDLSKVAFQQLFGKKWELGSVMNFLESPSLNAPEAGNLRFLCKWLIQNDVNQDIMHSFLNWIQRSTSLGTFSEEDISQVAKIATRFGPSNAANGDRMTQDILAAICEGLLKSSIYKIADLRAETLDTLLHCLSSTPLTIPLQCLGTNLITSSDEAQRRMMHHGISLFLQSWVLSQPIKTVEAPKTLRLCPAKELLKSLQYLPGDIARSSIVNASAKLLHQPTLSVGKREILVEKLRLWWFTLMESEQLGTLDDSAEWQNVKQSLASSDVEILASYLRVMSDQQKCLFLLDQWFGRQRHERHLGCWSDKFESLDGTHTSKSPFISMLRVLRHYDIMVSDERMSRLIALLREMGDSDTIVEIVEYQEKVGKRIKVSPITSAIGADLDTTPGPAYRVFDSYSMLPLEKVPRLAESIIANPHLHPNTIFYFRSQRKKLSLNSHPTHTNAPNQPISRRDLLERMCLAYAQAPHLPPRLALRKIRACYVIIKRERLGPISSAVTRALVEVGITRPLQDCAWVSTIKLRWILSLVRQVEGDEVADQIDQIVYKWRGMVLTKIRERYRMDSMGVMGGGMGLKLVKEKYDRIWLQASRKVYKPTDREGI